MNAVIQGSATGLRRAPSPLLKEEGHFSVIALISKVSNPIDFDRSVPRPRLSTHDQPVDIIETQVGDGA
jgi:hypothetical protein